MTAEGEAKHDGKKTPLPPGMVLGPDGKPCKICTAFRNWKPRTSSNIESDEHNKIRVDGSRGQSPTTAMMAAFTGASTATNFGKPVKGQPVRPDEPPPGCPPDVEQLGRATWTFLHTTAAYYPDKPTPNQRANMLTLLRSLPVLYPCTWCAEDFGENMSRHAPNVSSRAALSQWLCERHNEVNERLGKEKFDCIKVDERWKDGPSDGSCD